MYNLEHSSPRPKSSSGNFGDNIHDFSCGHNDIPV